ncbi:hypothetical protein [Cellulosimicrobium phage DS1]|nr:hypothetical protein [Cellulosimicrobium phage DS1]
MSVRNSNLSPAPGTPQTSAKAIAAGVTGGTVAFLSSLIPAASDNVVTGQEWLTVGLATVLGLAAAFGITWNTPNKPL